MISGCAPSAPLCPGSTRIVLPDTAARLSDPAAVVGPPDPWGEGGGDGRAEGGDAEVTGDPAEEGTAGALDPHPAPRPSSATARPTAAPVRRQARTRVMLLAGRGQHDLRPSPPVTLRHDRQYLAGRVEHRVRRPDAHRLKRSAVPDHP